MDKSIEINGVDISQYNLYLASIPAVPSPEQDVERIEIKGRNGSLTKKYGYKDIEYALEFFFFDDIPFKLAFRKAKILLFSATSLLFTDDPTVYYKIKHLTIETAENDIINYGKFVVNFILDPFQYDVENPIQTITEQTVITNKGYKSEPIITAQVSGTGKIYVNDHEIIIQNVNGSITIDSEMKNAYRKSPTGLITENMNNHMIGHFPALQHGDNVIDFSGDIEKIELIKNLRWR